MNFGALLLLAGYVYVHGHGPNLSANLAYRLSWGDLNAVAASEQTRPSAVRIQQGAETILDRCLSGSGGWERDLLIFRLAHAHAATSIGCREKANPSMHVVFYRQPDGTREAWAHFDLYGAGNRLAHAAEVIENNLTRGRTSQMRVYRRLVKRWATSPHQVASILH